jgi:hypothetical protein
MRNRFFASLFVVVALVFGVTNSASADQWDYIYGEDPTNANNVSANQNVRIDPLGGAFITGYFFGNFEGLSSNGQWGRFVQHRNAAGTTDWTVIVGLTSGMQPPDDPDFFEVDGDGTAYIGFYISGHLTPISVSQSGTITMPQQGDFGGNAGNRCGIQDAIADPVAGLIVLCVRSNHLSKYSAGLVREWDSDMTDRVGSSVGGTIIDASLLRGADSTVWVISTFNGDNIGIDASTLPAIFRPGIGMTRVSSKDGSREVSIMHYGIIARGAGVVGSDGNLWLATSDSSGRNPTTLISVFDDSTGQNRGTVLKNLGLYGANWKGDSESIVSWANANNLPTIGISQCKMDVFAYVSRPWINSEPDSCSRFKIFNDGRRLAMAVEKSLYIFEISGDVLPQITRLISNTTFAGDIQDIDSDYLGNIVIVGRTFESVVVPQSIDGARGIASLSSSRAFISRNPMGRISLDVLPRTPLRIKVAGTNGVPATGVGAVSMNVTVTSPDGEGFITVYPCDTKPDASNLNYTLNQTVPNAVIAPVSSTGEVCFYTNAQTHLLADINGYFPTGQGFTAAGPARVFDTRAASGQGLRTVNKVKISGDQEVRVKMTDLAGLTPSTGVGAVSLNITATGTAADDFGGYVTVYPCGNRPNASSINFVSGQTVPNAVIAPVSASGEVCFYARGTTDLIVDINGYFLSGAGFTPTAPTRIADTRAGSAQGTRTVTKTKIGGDTTLKVKFTDIAGLTPTSGVGAVSLNVTATGTAADEFGGYVTVYPCGAIPNASNLNFISGQIVPNAVIAPVSASGEVCFYARGTTDLIVDINGYFPTGAGFTPMSPVRLFDTR